MSFFNWLDVNTLLPEPRKRAMIDKLEVLIPKHSEIRPSIRRALDELPNLQKPGSLYRSGHDLESLGIPAVLLCSCQYTEGHRMSLFRVADMSKAAILACIRKVIDAPEDVIRQLRVARVDLAVDVADHSVEWFDRHAYVPRKKRHERIGYPLGGVYLPQTLVFGSRPDRIVIYDKVEEVLSTNQRRHKRRKPLLTVPAGPVTRVERQTSSNHLLSGFETIVKLLDNAPLLLPFGTIQFGHVPARPLPTDLKPETYYLFRSFTADVEEDGLDTTLRKWRQRDPKHWSRVLRTRILPLIGTASVDAPNLNEMYAARVTRQLHPLLTATEYHQYGDASVIDTYLLDLCAIPELEQIEMPSVQVAGLKS